MATTDLLTSLHSLWDRLSRHASGDKRTGGMLERYVYFLEHSEHGENCAYAVKSKDLFLRFDYEEIRDLFLTCLTEFRKVEGEDWGK